MLVYWPMSVFWRPVLRYELNLYLVILLIINATHVQMNVTTGFGHFGEDIHNSANLYFAKTFIVVLVHEGHVRDMVLLA